MTQYPITISKFMINAKQHIKAAALHMLQKSSLNNAFLKNCCCIRPEERKKALIRCRNLTDDKTQMCEKTLNAAMTVKIGVKNLENRPHLLPESQRLIELSRHVWQS